MNYGFSAQTLRTSLMVDRSEEGFCCWRQNPAPFYAGDPCACPTEHRGDYSCPPDGCTDGNEIWQRGPGTESNTKAFCHQFVEVASWCPSARSFSSPLSPAAAPAGTPAPTPAPGFCCYRDHPAPGYYGEPCGCPTEHRGDYTCPEEGCTDSTGARWRRGETAPFANTQAYCSSMDSTAAWCPSR